MNLVTHMGQQRPKGTAAEQALLTVEQAAVARQWSGDGLENIEQRDLVGRAAEDEAPTGAAPRADQARPGQPPHDLRQVRRRNVLFSRDLEHRMVGAILMMGKVGHGVDSQVGGVGNVEYGLQEYLRIEIP